MQKHLPAHTYVYKHTHTHTHTDTRTATHSVHVSVHSICIQTHTYTHTQTHALLLTASTLPSTASSAVRTRAGHSHSRICIQTHTYTHTDTHTQTHALLLTASTFPSTAYVYKHIHTHTHRHTPCYSRRPRFRPQHPVQCARERAVHTPWRPARVPPLSSPNWQTDHRPRMPLTPAAPVKRKFFFLFELMD